MSDQTSQRRAAASEPRGRAPSARADRAVTARLHRDERVTAVTARLDEGARARAATVRAPRADDVARPGAETLRVRQTAETVRSPEAATTARTRRTAETVRCRGDAELAPAGEAGSRRAPATGESRRALAGGESRRVAGAGAGDWLGRATSSERGVALADAPSRAGLLRGPARFHVAVAGTAALAVLGLGALLGGGDAAPAGPGAVVAARQAPPAPRAQAAAPVRVAAPQAGPQAPATPGVGLAEADLRRALGRDGQADHAAHDHADDDGHGCSGGDEEARAAFERLEVAVHEDPAALEQALGRLERGHDPDELELMAALLGRVRDPRVERLALRMATTDALPDRRRAGFEVLDGLDTLAAAPAVLEALERERDVAVRRAALHAVPPPAGASERDATAVVGALERVLTGDDDPESRRRAAVALGAWGRPGAGLDAVVHALLRDPSVDVRAGAAWALEVARSDDPAIRAALVQALGRPGEDPLVRDNAWHALGAAGRLADGEQAVWTAYAQEVAAREAR